MRYSRLAYHPSTWGNPMDPYTPPDPVLRSVKVAMLAFGMAFFAVVIVGVLKMVV